MTDFLQVTTTVDSREGADVLASTLVERRIAACVQVIGPITSTYWWNGARETAEEWLCLIKTSAPAYPALERAIHELHPYEVPEILATPVQAGSASYLEWLQEQVRVTQ